MAEDYIQIGYILLVAVGAAMAGGTGLALLRWRRTGLFPGQPVDEQGVPQGEPSMPFLIGRVVVGLALIAWGASGLLTR